MPKGAGPQREHEYEKLVNEFQQEHRYPGREDEVASRIVNKQRSEHGETKEDLEKDQQHESPDKNLPIPKYDRLDVDELVGKLEGLDDRQVEALKKYEQKNNARKTLLEAYDRRLK
jgi:hypothetical protein